MVNSPKEILLAIKKINLNTLKLELVFKEALLSDFVAYVAAIYKWCKAHPENYSEYEIPEDIKTPKGIVSLWQAFDHANVPLDPLLPTYYEIRNRLDLVEQIEMISLMEYLQSGRIHSLRDGDLVTFIEAGHYYTWAKRIRRHYYLVVIKDEDRAKVPQNRAKREPEHFLEDAIKNLEEDIQALEQS